MNEEIKKALESGEVFSKEYVHQLREEAKGHRLKAENLEKTIGDLPKNGDSQKGLSEERISEMIAKAITAENRNFQKKIEMQKINFLCENAGIKVSAEQIYQDGKSADDSFKDFTEKNPDLFRKKFNEINGVEFGDGESGKTLMGGNIREIRKNPEARNIFSKIYQRAIALHKQEGRFQPSAKE